MKHNLTIVVLLDWNTLWSFHSWRMYRTCPLPFWLREMTLLFLQLAEMPCIISWLLYICNSWFESFISCILTKATLCRLTRMYKFAFFWAEKFHMYLSKYSQDCGLGKCQDGIWCAILIWLVIILPILIQLILVCLNLFAFLFRPLKAWIARNRPQNVQRREVPLPGTRPAAWILSTLAST